MDSNYALGEFWERHRSFNAEEGAVARIVSEFGVFVDNPTIRVRYSAQLLNFQSPVDRIELPNGLVIRRMSAEELSAVMAGAMFQPRFSGLFGINEFVIEGEYDEPKVLGERQDGWAIAKQYQDSVRQSVEKAVLTLRTFKDGRVGYDFIRHKTVTFCPLPLPAFGSGDLYIPLGRYDLSSDEIENLRSHADGIFAVTDPALQMACSRLSDAQIRNRPQDQLVDAVIGLEAVLLAAGGRIEGELKFRLSLNYAMLHERPAERSSAYQIAKDLYNLRSSVAHGRSLGDRNRVGRETLSGNDAAKRACEALRFVITHFLREEPGSTFKSPAYWEQRYFGTG